MNSLKTTSKTWGRGFHWNLLFDWGGKNATSRIYDVYFITGPPNINQYCFARWRLLSVVVVVVCNAAGGRASRPLDAWAVSRRRAGRGGGRHCTAGQYSYVPLGWHLVITIITTIIIITTTTVQLCLWVTNILVICKKIFES